MYSTERLKDRSELKQMCGESIHQFLFLYGVFTFAYITPNILLLYFDILSFKTTAISCKVTRTLFKYTLTSSAKFHSKLSSRMNSLQPFFFSVKKLHNLAIRRIKLLERQHLKQKMIVIRILLSPCECHCLFVSSITKWLLQGHIASSKTPLSSA